MSYMNRINLCYNPSGDRGLSWWAWVAASLDITTEWADTGTNSFKLKPTGNATASDMRTGSATTFPFGMQPGKTYSVSATMRLADPQVAATDRRARSIMFGHSIDGTSYVTDYGTQGPNVAGTFRSKATFTIPAHAVGFIFALGVGSNNTADTIWWDSVLIEEGTEDLPYFDNNTPTQPIPGTDDVYVHGYLGTPGSTPIGQYRRPNPDIGPRPEQTNHIINSSFEMGGLGWENGPGTKFTIVPTPNTIPPELRSGSHALKVSKHPDSAYQFPEAFQSADAWFPVTPGQFVSASATVYSIDQSAGIQIQLYSRQGTRLPTYFSGGKPLARTPQTIRVEGVVPSDAATARLVLKGSPSDGAYYDRVTTAAGPYFDGDTPDEPVQGSSSFYRHDWVGMPHLSASTRTLIYRTNDWTKRWYSTLPHAYQAADKAQQQPGHTEQPLLHFMDGIGQIAGRMRHISDQAWNGDLTNPDTTPDHALPWLGQMLGAPVSMQNLPLAQLRTHLQDMKNDGRPAVGTRAAIITAARQFLTGDSQALIPPTSPGTPAHTIIMLVRSDQVPDGNLAAIEQKIRAAGVIPAGHALSVRMARSSWDGWQAAAGITWNDVEKNTKTWAIADSLGIELEN